MGPSHIPQVLLPHLEKLEPDATFTGSLPKIQSSSGKCYFAKVGLHSERDQYVGEAESLKTIERAAPGLSPRVFAFGCIGDSGSSAFDSTGSIGTQGGQMYFLSEYKDLRRLTPKAENALAKRLATELHRYKSTQGFGFGVATYCGATRQENGWYQTWDVCYNEMIASLLGMLRRKQGGSRYADLCRKGEEVRRRVIPHLLASLDIEPVLLHGDLWNGNIGMVQATGEPIIFDPSSMYGHNEADLAIARIFGGFSTSFFTTYHEHFPKAHPVDQYDSRIDLYELYHYLNHTVIFGGSYAVSAMQKMDKLLEQSPAEKL